MKRMIKKAPWQVILLIASFLCPTELSLYIAGLRLPPHRVALIILFPIAIMRLLSQQGLRLRSFDVFFLFFNLWTVGVFVYHHGQHEGLVYGGSQALESLGAYLVARVWIRTEDELRATLRIFGYAIAVAALIALPETLLGQIWTHNILHAITGYYHPIGIEERMGLTRAYGVFDHPIHYGTFCAALAAMFWFSQKGNLNRFKMAGLLTGATLLGLSSAPLLCLGMQGAMIAWDRFTRWLPKRATLTFVIVAILYVAASLFSTRGPIAVIATGMTLDPWTGFYRLQIWENGMNNVWMYPLTGLGLNDWDRPSWMFSDTVDAYWLVVMMRMGIPALLLLIISIGLLIRNVNKRTMRAMKGKRPSMRIMARAWTMSLIAISLIATTVHLWNVTHTFFFFFLGIGAMFADPRKLKVKAKTTAARQIPEPLPGHHVYPPGPQSGYGDHPLPSPYPHGAYAH